MSFDEWQGLNYFVSVLDESVSLILFSLARYT